MTLYFTTNTWHSIVENLVSNVGRDGVPNLDATPTRVVILKMGR